MTAKNSQFNHLKIHTQYSICEGALKISDLSEIDSLMSDIDYKALIGA